MKRFHVNLAVADLQKSMRFYSNLFGTEPAVAKSDYAKWMLEDPCINFSISHSRRKRGIDHIGLQADSTAELAEIQARLAAAGEDTVAQPDAECCYAKSTKTWVRDPDDVAWETFVTFGEMTRYGDDLAPDDVVGKSACCDDDAGDACCVSGN